MYLPSCERTFPKHRDENLNVFRTHIPDHRVPHVKEHSLNIGTKTYHQPPYSTYFVVSLVKEHSLNIGTKTCSQIPVCNDIFPTLQVKEHSLNIGTKTSQNIPFYCTERYTAVKEHSLNIGTKTAYCTAWR